MKLITFIGLMSLYTSNGLAKLDVSDSPVKVYSSEELFSTENGGNLNFEAEKKFDYNYKASDDSQTFTSNAEDDGTTIKSELINGHLQDIRCRCNIQSAFKVIEGESFNRSKFANKDNKCERVVATNLIHGSMMVYYNVDFSSNGARAIVLKMASDLSNTSIAPTVKIYIDKANGQSIATFNTQNTGKICHFINHKVLLDTIVTGIHDLYFVISDDYNNDSIEALDLDWFIFSDNMDLIKCSLSEIDIVKPYVRHYDNSGDVWSKCTYSWQCYKCPCHCYDGVCMPFM